MKFRAVILLGLFSVLVPPAEMKGSEFLIRPSVTIGTGVLYERNNDNATETTRLPLGFGIGAHVDRWQARIEYSSFRTSDGNPTVSISRSHELFIGWGAFEFGSLDGWIPYGAFGLGSGRTNVEARVLGGTDASKGNWDGMFAAAMGLRANWTSHFSVRPEIRYESAESFKMKDARFGLALQADYAF